MNYISKLLVILLLVFASCSKDKIAEANYKIVPLPNNIDEKGGESFFLDKKTKIFYTESNIELKQVAEKLSEYIESSTGIKLKLTTQKPQKYIELNSDLKDTNSEAYLLNISTEKIEISGASGAGVFYGVQTLRKAIPVESLDKIVFPQVSIKDYPKFKHRGMMLDVSRHFFPVDFVKKYIDILALHNLNTFHWHLSDDQGWRIEIKKYPKLTEISSKRKETVIGRNSGKYDGVEYGPYFYTQEEITEVIEYAKERFITIIPEIDLPGHMLAALAAYPEYGCTKGPYAVWPNWGVEKDVLCAGDSATYEFAKDILAEVIELFPSKMIHIGGDECPKDRWRECPKCQALIKEKGFRTDTEHTAEQKLQSHFMSEMEKFVNDKGRSIIGWDEILEGGVSPTATVMSWRGIKGGIEAARRGNNVIMAPNTYMYFDYYQSRKQEDEPFGIGGFVPLEKVYSYNPFDSELTTDEAKYILGVQANMWTEYILNPKHAEYMLTPRIAALSEVQWTEPEKKDINDFKLRLIDLLSIYDNLDINYATHIIDVYEQIKEDKENNRIILSLYTNDNVEIRYTDDGSEPTINSLLYTEPIIIKETKSIKSVAVRKGKVTKTNITNIQFNKATLKNINLVNDPKDISKLVDGQQGSSKSRFNSINWLGFKFDIKAIIDFGQEFEISEIKMNTNVETEVSIFGATNLQIETSVDNRIFNKVFNEEYPILAKPTEGVIPIEAKFEKQKARYVRVTLNPTKVIPEWHQNKGGMSSLYLDEIIIN